jgi:hypothetical protein
MGGNTKKRNACTSASASLQLLELALLHQTGARALRRGRALRRLLLVRVQRLDVRRLAHHMLDVIAAAEL